MKILRKLLGGKSRWKKGVANKKTDEDKTADRFYSHDGREPVSLEKEYRRSFRGGRKDAKTSKSRQTSKNKRGPEADLVAILFVFKWICIGAVAMAAIWFAKWYLSNAQKDTTRKLRIARKRITELETQQAASSKVTTFNKFDLNNLSQRIASWEGSQKEMGRVEDLMQWQQRDEAIKHIKNVINLEPRHFEALKTMAQYYIKEEGHDKLALNLIVRALSSQPDDLELKLAMARVLFALDRSKDLLRVSEWILGTNPYNLETLRFAGQACLSLDNQGSALQFYERIIDQRPNDVSALEAVAGVLKEQGEYSQASEYYGKLIQLIPDNLGYYSARAFCQAQQEKALAVVSTLEMARARLGKAPVQAILRDSVFDSLRDNSDMFRGFLESLGKDEVSAEKLAQLRAQAEEKSKQQDEEDRGSSKRLDVFDKDILKRGLER